MADYLSAVMAAMKTHPRNPQMQGLGYLAMANLALRDDRHVGDITVAGGIEVILDSLAYMKDEANVQVRSALCAVIVVVVAAAAIVVVVAAAAAAIVVVVVVVVVVLRFNNNNE